MKKKMKRKIRFKIFLIVVLTALLIVSGLYVGGNIYLDMKLNKIDHGDEIKIDEADIAPEVIDRKTENVVVNFALFGADNAGSSSDQSDEDRSDAMKIVSLDYTNKKIKITSVERDVVVFIPGDYQKYGHFNWAYWFGGPELAVKTLNYNLDLDITQYVTFSFDALEKLVDVLDGVEINMTQKEVNYLKLGGKAGVRKLDGHTALMYCRIRKIDSDFNRMDRQNNVIQAVISKVKNQSILELMNLVEEMLPYISTNLTNSDIKKYLVDVLTFDLGNMETYKEPSGEYNDICTCPGLGGYLVRSYTDMVKNLHYNIYGEEDYQPSQTVIDNEKRTYEKYGEFKK